MKNKRQWIPSSQAAKNNITAYDFPEAKPIFWGPLQITVFPSTYNPPEGWRPLELLTLPRVARFFFGDGGTLGGGGGPCTGGPGNSCWKLVDITQRGPEHGFDYDTTWISVGGGTAHWFVSFPPGGIGLCLAFLDSTGHFTVPSSVPHTQGCIF